MKTNENENAGDGKDPKNEGGAGDGKPENKGKPAEGDGKPTDQDEGDEDASTKAAEELAAEQMRQRDEKKRQREIERAAKEKAEQIIKERDAEAKRKADLEKKPELERLTAEKEAAEKKAAALEETTKDLQIKYELANEFTDQELVPKSAKAREHIAAAFKSHVAAGKDPAAALAQVFEDEPYLFKDKAAPQQQEQDKGQDQQQGKTVAGKPGALPPGQKPKGTEAPSRGPTQNQRQAPPQQGQKMPSDAKDAAELAEIVQQRHGFKLRIAR